MSVTGDVKSLASGRHIEINLGNVLTVGMLSLLWWGGATWVSNYLSRTNIPVVSQAAIGAQYYLKAG